MAHVSAAPAVDTTRVIAAVIKQQASRDDRLMRALLALIGLYLVVTLALLLGDDEERVPWACLRGGGVTSARRRGA